MKFTFVAKRAGAAYPKRPRPGLVDMLATIGSIIVTIPLVALELAVHFFTLISPADLALNITVGICSIALTTPCLYVIWRDQPLARAFVSPWPERFRLAEFAQVNGFNHVLESPAPFAPLDAQAIPGSGIASNRLIDLNRPALEIANLSYTTLSWQDPVEIHVGYLAVERPHRVSSTTLNHLQATLDGTGLGLIVRAVNDWLVFYSASSFDLAAPHTYRLLLWLASQIDQRRPPLEPVSAASFVAEARQLARRRRDKLVQRLFWGSVVIAAVWVAAEIVVQHSR